MGSLAAGSTMDIPPMSEINTTPLIDVMLVLLIMFIITVPMQTHQVKVALPGETPPREIVQPIRNELALSEAGILAWNGRTIDDAQLAALLGEVASRPVEPEVHFRPEAGSRYERVDQVLAIAARSGAARFGFAGNERFSSTF